MLVIYISLHLYITPLHTFLFFILYIVFFKKIVIYNYFLFILFLLSGSCLVNVILFVLWKPLLTWQIPCMSEHTWQ